MAKPEDNPSPLPVAPKAPAAQVFHDKLYTSRVLILPDGRTLAVADRQVIAEPGDTVAQDYLAKHPELALQPE